MDKERQMSYLKGKDYYPYYGAGYIQLTGEGNYREFSKIMEDPKILEIGPEYVAKNYAWAAVGWWWNSAGMNQKISEGYTVDQVSGTVISWNKDAPDNGSYSERRDYYAMIYDILE